MTRDGYDKARGATHGLMEYLQPLFKAVGLTLAAMALLMALYLVVVVLLR